MALVYIHRSYAQEWPDVPLHELHSSDPNAVWVFERKITIRLAVKVPEVTSSHEEALEVIRKRLSSVEFARPKDSCRIYLGDAWITSELVCSKFLSSALSNCAVLEISSPISQCTTCAQLQKPRDEESGPRACPSDIAPWGSSS